MITSSSIDSSIEKAIFIITKKGCGNCEKTKPLLEKFEKEHEDTKVFIHEMENKDDEFARQFPEIRVFPGVFCLRKGKVISATNWTPHIDSFTYGFLPLAQKKEMAWDSLERIQILQAELKELEPFHIFMKDSVALEKMSGVTTPIEDFPLPISTAPLPEECEGCQ